MGFLIGLGICLGVSIAGSLAIGAVLRGVSRDPAGPPGPPKEDTGSTDQMAALDEAAGNPVTRVEDPSSRRME